MKCKQYFPTIMARGTIEALKENKRRKVTLTKLNHEYNENDLIKSK